MKQLLTALVLMVTLQPLAIAHAGPHEKVMGTLTAIEKSHLDIKATDGKTSTISLDAATKMIRGTKAITRVDLREGERVVVTLRHAKDAAGADVLIAEEVRVGSGSPPKTKDR
jgi:hypothetical protein